LAEEAHPHLTGNPKPWLDRLQAEDDNFRAAFDQFGAAGQTQNAIELAGALWKVWDIRGRHYAEGTRRFEAVLAEDSQPTPARARALNGATAMALMSRDPVTARGHAEAALALYRDIGDERGVALSIQLLGNVEAEEKHFEGALELFEDALRRFADLDDDHYVLLAMRLAAWMRHELGDVEGARELHEEVVRRARVDGNLRMQATSLGALGEYALREGRTEEARSLLEEGYLIDSDLGLHPEILVALWRFAWMLALDGRPVDAARVFSAAETMREEMAVPTYTWMKDENEATLSMIRAQVPDGTFRAAWQQGRKLTPEEAVALAVSG
jgi:tetratricopeptide (TPR) repeat protein